MRKIVLFCCLGCGNDCVFVVLCDLDAGNVWNGKGGLNLFVFLLSINDKGCYSYLIAIIIFRIQ